MGKHRQWSGLELIASENLTSRAVMECLGSALTNKYAEGYPGKRYYGGNEFIDQVERLCVDRALQAYGLNPEQWGINVQPYSGSPANFAVYTALLRPHDRIMGLDLPSGGHLTHGFYTFSKAEGTRKAVSATSVYFESLPYRVHPETGIIDYDALAAQASLFKPAMIIMGGSAYPREWDYARFRQIADENGSLLMMDMAHISGLVATGEVDSPFKYADVVTTTTHKSLRGPRAGVATQLKEVATPYFKEYCVQVRANAAALADQLVKHGHTLATGGTENHLVLWDLKPMGVTGSKMQAICDALSITLNKNAVLGDKSALTPGGVRIGSPALTTRGLNADHFRKVADFLHQAVTISQRIQKETGKPLKAFEAALKTDEEVKALRLEVKTFITQFPMPGFDVDTMKYKEFI